MPRSKKTQNQIFKELFNGITADDILKYANGKFIVGGNELPPADTQALISGARAIKEMFVWKQLLKDMRYEANKMMFDNSLKYEDMLSGKMVLWTLDVMEKKLESLSKIKWEK